MIEKILGGPGQGVTGAIVRNLKTGETQEVPCGGIFMAIGHTPNTAVFEGQLEHDEQGYLLVHERHDGDERAGRLRRRRRGRPPLPAGDHRRRQRLHGGDRRRALPEPRVGGALRPDGVPLRPEPVGAADATRHLPGSRMTHGLRILFLAPQPFFEVRGTPLAVLHMTRALAALGHEVDLLTFPQGEAGAEPTACATCAACACRSAA